MKSRWISGLGRAQKRDTAGSEKESKFVNLFCGYVLGMEYAAVGTASFTLITLSCEVV